jgi:hypothetical protein
MGSTTIVQSEPAEHGHPPQLQPPAELVREQLGRILVSHLFKNSKHYPALLRYVVEETLEGRSRRLKERSLGVDVFGRDPNYDTNLDPVVRTSACEVRKRIAQYYHEPGRETEIRIDLPHGSYVAEFRFPEGYQTPVAEPEPVTAQAAAEAAGLAGQRWKWTRRQLVAIVLTTAVVAIATVALRTPRSAMQQFWGPVWDSAESVTLYVSGPYGPNPKDATPSQPGPSYLDVMKNDTMAFADAVSMARVAALLRENAKKFDIRRGTASTLEDLRKGPDVLIGGFNNPWTMRLGTQLRFALERNPAIHTGFIRDRQNPSKVVWSQDAHLPYSSFTEDYAIVSRFVDPRTEKTMVVVAGMGKNGTLAAGEFVTNSRYLEMLAARAPKGWEHKNVEVVIATEVVNDNTGPPRILATYFW